MTGISLSEAVTKLTAEDPRFALGTADIRGTSYRVFKNLPDHTHAMMTNSRSAQGNGALEYLVFENQRWTYSAFQHDVDRMAHRLHHDFGVSQGTRVAIAMRNCPAFLIAIMAISALGGVTVFLNAWWITKELDYALRDSAARLIIADDDRAERLAALKKPLSLSVISLGTAHADGGTVLSKWLMGCDIDYPTPGINPDEDFAIMYSSGTTGNPKGVVQTHRGAISAVYTWLMQSVMAPLIDPPPSDAPPPPRPVVLIVTPLFHVTATHPMFLLSMPAGAKLVVMHKWCAETAARLIEDEQVTRFLGVPTQSADLMAAAERLGLSLSTLSYIGAGGAKRPAAQVGDLIQQFPQAQIATGWGMTETNANGIGLIGDDYLEHPGAAGRLYPPVQEIRFLDDDGRVVAPGEVGEITVKSPCNMRKYLNKPKETANTLHEGWLRTGDLGRINDNGIITIVDRKKNIIIRGGENIACLDVEGALHRHPDVLEACAFALPDDRLGEVVGASVQCSEKPVTQDALQTFLTGQIAHFKVPIRIWIQSDPLPRGATDKLDRRTIQATCHGDFVSSEGKN
ncbi:MAG: class I adenylate-forming enzyme family protein [Tateyamaria sp.]|nr:class I adenylate-forming enzyme family protein [Tateyamaria sp.]MDG1334538.1 class I adenylate-forming enzyme family protein [Tateyamaria sp.]MDG2058128.1 class I adenylate-forming enzyme family protein [Tateyamaria sp.]